MKRLITSVLCGALCCLLLAAGCDESFAPQEPLTGMRKLAYEYRYAQMELAVADSVNPYLVIATDGKRLEIQQNGAVVWDEPYELTEQDSARLKQTLLNSAAASPLPMLRYIEERRLLEYQKRYADSVLTIISGILNVSPDLLQRELPVRFELKTSDGLLFRFEASDDSLLTKPRRSLLPALQRMFGLGGNEPVATFRMPMERALTLFHVAHPGATVLIDPPSTR